MEEVEKRAESPSSKIVSSSRLSGQDPGADSEMKEPSTKKKSAGSKRKNRNAEKENGDVSTSANGEVHANEIEAESQNVESKPDKMVASTSSNEQNGNEMEEVEGGTGCGKASPETDGKPVNGNVENENGESEKPESRQTDGTEEANEMENENENQPKEIGDEIGQGDPDETNREPETVADEQVAEQDENKTTADEEIDRENENGFEGRATGEKSDSIKGFFKSWSFGLVPEKKEPETNGVPEESTNGQLYYSSIQGRMPLKRTYPARENVNESVGYKKGFITPTNPSRSLDDSFGVKSEPSRIYRAESKEKPNLRKFPAKRCLNADDSDEKEDGFISNISFNKRRKIEDERAVSGFLRSFLWSPFRKRNLSDDVAPDEESEDKTTVAKPWFRSPFWFWKRFNKEERN